MKHYQFVSKRRWQPVKEKLIQLVHDVQDEVREYFTFRYEFVGSAKRNMITEDVKSNIGFDFDINIYPNDSDENYQPEEIKEILMSALNQICKKYGYDYCEDSTRVITIKVKNSKKSKIIHSCDFAIVNEYEDDDGNMRGQYIHYNKSQNSYTWENLPNGYYNLDDRILEINQQGLNNDLRELYLKKKNNNTDESKKSRSLLVEAVNEIYIRL